MSELILEVKKASKKFPGTQALSEVNFVLQKGEIHALVGENGAGKSTLMNILMGVYQKDSGEVLFEGESVVVEDPLHANKLGIRAVYQELSLAPHLSIAENIFINNQPLNALGVINKPKMNQEATKLMRLFDIDINPDTLIKDVSIALKQLVEVARAISQQCKVIILDEPTASLTDHEIKKLFEVMLQLKAEGIAIIYISHKLEEVLEISDRVTVLKDGKQVCMTDTRQTTKDEIIINMVGRELQALFPEKSSGRGNMVMEVKNLSGDCFENITFSVKAGEVLGFAGLTGAGRTEMFRAIFGIDRRLSGKIYIDGIERKIKIPADAVRYGLGYLPEDRKDIGLFLSNSVKDNIIVSSLKKVSGILLMNLKRARYLTMQQVNDLNIKVSNINQEIASLSGGNQQKALIGRWLTVSPKILVVDEPTRGVDVGAKAEIHKLLRKLADEGMAIILISSELLEILGMSDRIITVWQGQITNCMINDHITEQDIVRYIYGERGQAVNE